VNYSELYNIRNLSYYVLHITSFILAPRNFTLSWEAPTTELVDLTKQFLSQMVLLGQVRHFLFLFVTFIRRHLCLLHRDASALIDFTSHFHVKDTRGRRREWNIWLACNLYDP
jgi:hypothetical protein